MNKVPILILAFNRPNHVIRVMEAVRAYQPNCLYLACDGPRKNKKGESELVMATRKAMLDAVDWECEVKTLFRDKNLGCAQAVFEAMTWFFKHEEYGVIIEDDVIVGKDFFTLCEEMLPRFANDDRVMMISAQNRRTKELHSNELVFGTYTYIWGWATWRRAWDKMDMEMCEWPSCRKSELFITYGFFTGLFKWRAYRNIFNHIDSSRSWAMRWAFAVFINHGLVLMPKVNLAVNIGVGVDNSTNYRVNDKDPHRSLAIGRLDWPLIYPSELVVDKNQLKENQKDYLRERLFGLRNKLNRLWH